MRDFVFSADAHVVEPRGMYEERLPASLRDKALRTEKRDGYLLQMGGGQVLHRMQLSDGNSGLADQDESPRRSGGHDIALRLGDMERDGIDAEVIFPTLGLMVYMVDRELALASAQIYNDWCMEHFGGHLDRFVPTAILPGIDPGEAATEFKRVAALGYRSAMLPVDVQENVPKYNRDDWDPVWQVAHDTGIPVNLHAATGAPPVSIRGPGASVMNYTRLAFKAQDAIAMLVSGGALDRFPKLTFITVECGASWLVYLGERMDETYKQHQHYVSPRLSKLPSELLYSQVKATFQYDRACIANRSTTGHQALLWASDYPHMEGTFPRSREVIRDLFGTIDISDTQRQDILGGTAARLYRLPGHETTAAAGR